MSKLTVRSSDSIHTIPPRGHKLRKATIVFLTLAPLLFGVLALFLGQDANWDLRNYHWYNGYAFATGRYLVDLLPSQTPFFYNPTLDVPFYLLASHVSARTAAFVLGTIQGINFVLLFMLAHASLIIPNPRQKIIACSVIAAIGMLGAGELAQLGTTFYDNVTSIGIFLSALLVVRHFDVLINGPLKRALTLAFVAGLPAGMMMGLKLPSVIFCLGLCFALLFVTGSLRRRFLISFVFGLGVLAGVAITLGHWMWFLQANFDSPLFPYFNNVFKSPFAPLTSARDVQFIPGTWHDRLLFPFIFTEYPTRVGEIPWRDWKIPALYVALPLAIILRLIFGRNAKAQDNIAAPLPTRYLLWTAVISYVVWLVVFSIYRYAVPLEMIAPLLMVMAISILPLRLQARSMLAAFVLGILAVTVQPGNWTRKNEWLPRAVETDIPPLGTASDLMILMAGFEPYSHVLTAFPPEIPFVRIQSNFSSPEENKGINQLLEEKIEEHNGRFKLLIPSNQRHHAKPALAWFNLSMMQKTCRKVTDRLFDSRLVLCDVERMDSP